MRTYLVWTIAFVVACGDDSTDDGASTSTTDGTGTSTSTTTSGPTSSTTTPTTSTTTDTGTTDSGETTMVDGSTTQSGSSGSTGTGTTTGGGNQACLPPEVFEAIDQHAHDLVTSADLLAGHPSTLEVTGFLSAPGLPEPPALVSQFVGPLIMPCSDPMSYDPFCEAGRCTQIECTGNGAGWIYHLWIDPALAVGNWDFQEVTIDVLWIDGETGTSFDIATSSTAPGGLDISMTGSGTMDTDAFAVTETFPDLHPAGETVLTYMDDAQFSGTLTIAGTVVADVDAGGHLQPTGDCP